MKQTLLPTLLGLTLGLFVAADASAQQTIVFMRHGEKPSAGLGQMNCQGLNRALALPDVLLSKFGTPDLIYVPNPTVKIPDPSGSYYYVRPLAFIEPTAIRTGRSVNTHFGYSSVTSMQPYLITPTNANTTVFVVWEHSYLVKMVQNIMNQYGGGAAVPAWTTGDFDSLYVVRVDYSGGQIHAQFSHEHENLNNQATACP